MGSVCSRKLSHSGARWRKDVGSVPLKFRCARCIFFFLYFFYSLQPQTVGRGGGNVRSIRHSGQTCSALEEEWVDWVVGT